MYSLVRFFYKPLTLSALACGLVVLAYIAMTQDVLEEGRDKRRVYESHSYSCDLPFIISVKWGLRSDCVVSPIRDDSVSRWPFHSPSSSLLAYNFGCQSTLRACFSLPAFPGPRYGSADDDLYRFQSRKTSAREKLWRRLRIHNKEFLGIDLISTRFKRLIKLLRMQLTSSASHIPLAGSVKP